MTGDKSRYVMTFLYLSFNNYSVIVDSVEVSPVFNTGPIEGMGVNAA